MRENNVQNQALCKLISGIVSHLTVYCLKRMEFIRDPAEADRLERTIENLVYHGLEGFFHIEAIGQQMIVFHKAIVKATIAIELDDEAVKRCLKLKPDILDEVILQDKEPNQGYVNSKFDHLQQGEVTALEEALTSLKFFANTPSHSYNFKDANEQAVHYPQSLIQAAVVEEAKHIIFDE